MQRKCNLLTSYQKVLTNSKSVEQKHLKIPQTKILRQHVPWVPLKFSGKTVCPHQLDIG